MTLGSYVIIIGIYVIGMCVIGDMTYVTEVLVRTGGSLGIAVLLVVIVEALQRADKKRAEEKKTRFCRIRRRVVCSDAAVPIICCLSGCFSLT